MIAREIEKTGIPVVQVTAMSTLAKQLGVNRVVAGTKIPHPCGDPTLPAEADLNLRQKIVETVLRALQTDVKAPTVFVPNASYSPG